MNVFPTLLSTLAKVLREVEAGRYHGVACAAAALEAARPAPGNDCRMEHDDFWRALQAAVAYAEEVSCDSEG